MYLNTHSYYSLRYGTMSLEDLFLLAQKNNVQSFALTDINNTMGIPLFVKLAKKHNIKPIAGADIRNGSKHLYTVIAKNNKGLQELNEYISRHNINKKDYPDEAKGFDNACVIYPFGSRSLKQLKDNELVGIRPRETGKLLTSEFRNAPSKLVISQPVTFADRDGFFIHKNLRAIDHNTLISKLNGQQTASPSELMLPADKLLSYYKNYPGIIKNTEKLVDECSIDIDFDTIKNKKTFTGNRYDDKLLLEKLSLEGIQYRHGSNREAKKRVNHEMDIIYNLGFASYFLIAWDIIRYSMSRGFYHVGRGSGANSIVAYCLKITDVDPIDLDLYFERFINPKRTSPPDFDIDYSWKDRDDVQDYIFKRYGRQHVALLGATSTFRGRSIYRELGKVYGLPKAEIDGLVHHPEADINKNDITMRIHKIARKLFDFPNIRSIHAGGILISEDPITCYTALDMPPKGFPTTQWDMYVAEDLGYEKFDILSQRGIGHIREAADIIRENRKINIDVHQAEKFKKDKQVRYQLKIGGFYRSWVYFNEAKRWGANIELPCVNNSTQKTCIKGKSIYIGFAHISNLELQTGKNIQKEREQNGEYAGLEDFVNRVNTGIEQLIILIRTGAFRFMGKPKAQLLWEAHMLTGKSTSADAGKGLFGVHSKKFELPDFEHSRMEDAYDEMEFLDFPVSMSMFDMLQTTFRGEVLAGELKNNIGKKVRMVGQYVAIKYVRTIKKEIMNFGTFIDVQGEFFDTTHFPGSIKKYPFRGRGCYLILGKAVEEFGFPGVEVEKMARLPLKPDPRG